MPIFRCLIRGENFPGKLIGKRKPIGFFTTRFIEAETAENAELLAVEMLRDDPDLSVSPEFQSTDARVYFEEIHKLTEGSDIGSNKGFTFFVGT